MTKKTTTYLLCLCMCFAISNTIFAEGSKELAPNENTLIGTVNTNDIAALHINHPEYNFFASYNNPDETSRLYIHITDPLSESIFVGFSLGHLNSTSPNPTTMDYEYRIKDPNGNVVFGPIRILANDSGEGVIEDWDAASSGVSQLGNAGGYMGREVISDDLIAAGWLDKGDYYIEFTDMGGGPFLIDHWDITVVDNSSGTAVEKQGRVWSYNWALFAINDFGFPNRPFNGAFYVCAPDELNPDAAYITKIDFNNSGFQPAAFNIAFNSFGIFDNNNVVEDRKSFENGNMTTPEYPIFLNDPVDVCETATVGSFTFNGFSGCDLDEYCIDITATKPGQINILLDFDGQDGVFTPGTADLVLGQNISVSEVGTSVCIPWDGRDGLGQIIQNDPSTDVFLSLSFSEGIYHFPIYDAEFLFTGYQLETVRPSGPQPKLFYDDSNITAPSGVSEPKVQLEGCILPCHTWSNFDGNAASLGYGNLNTINSWWFSQVTNMDEVIGLPGPTVRDETVELCPGENIVINGETYSTPGMYTQMLTNVAGCDSTINLTITLGVCDDCIPGEQRQEMRLEITRMTETHLDAKIYMEGNLVQTLTGLNELALEKAVIDYITASKPRLSTHEVMVQSKNMMKLIHDIKPGRTLKSR